MDVCAWSLLLGIVTIVLSSGAAMHEDQVGSYDWYAVRLSCCLLSAKLYSTRYRQFVGAVSFVALDQGSQVSKRVLVASEEGVLAALNGKTGHLGGRATFGARKLISAGIVIFPVQSGGTFMSQTQALSTLCCFKDPVSPISVHVEGSSAPAAVIFSCIYLRAHMLMDTCMCNTHACTHTYVHTPHIHSHIHIHALTHTHTPINNAIAAFTTVSNGGRLIRSWDVAQGTLHWETTTGFENPSE